jgi:hypothetical protein
VVICGILDEGDLGKKKQSVENSPPAPDEEEVRPRLWCMPYIATAVPRGSTLTRREVSAPVPTPSEDCACDEVEPSSTLVAPAMERTCIGGGLQSGTWSGWMHIVSCMVAWERWGREEFAMDQWRGSRDYFRHRVQSNYRDSLLKILITEKENLLTS